MTPRLEPGFTSAAGLTADITLTPQVCIIGSGAGGAVTASMLAAAGLDVLVLEEGGHYTHKDFRMQEAEAYPTLYQESAARVTADLAVTILQGRAVGGTTVVNWTTCFRTPTKVLDHWRVNHAVQGLTTRELDPHWEAVEARLHIHKVPEAEMNRNNRLLFDGCRQNGWQVETTHRNVLECRQSGYCGMGCPVDAKQSMLVTYLPDAVQKGATVLSRCRVDRLKVDGRTVTEAHCSALDAPGIRPTGVNITVKARYFILSAGAIGSPSVLLRSGLEGDVAGRRTFLHPVVASSGVYELPVLASYGAPQSAASHHFVDRGDKTGFVLEAAPLHPVLMSTALSGLGPDHHANMQKFPYVAPHLSLTVDGFFPDETGGTVKIRPSGAPVLDYAMPPRVQEAMREGQKRLAEEQFASGAQLVITGHEPAMVLRSAKDIALLNGASFAPGDVFMASAHVMGGCPMGEDPKRAVVRCEDLRAHRYDNLHVVDGSVFPTSLGVNPQLSIYGLAHLAASRLVSTFKPA